LRHTGVTILYGPKILRKADLQEMAKQVAWFDAKPEWRTEVLTLQASTSAYFGQIKKARSLLQQAIAIKDPQKTLKGALGSTFFGVIWKQYREIRLIAEATRQKFSNIHKTTTFL
jgi:hypothetical protein